ncbi:MAG: hypothetical protein EAZ60_25055 [Oscillatoriales cyanobacterium]|nr:MAG: hypothetical protein EAZ83_29135 [Oscillatoriales cyanobacterium]TAF14362.1 MAG: hypothetical protein EAZ73_29025 [Oscillatoriales cyanobacterium]TAF51860.1 MAG: hypothetical protein EAZ60_25055 [Oscillatoriales cyanobacterium]
MRSAHLRQLGKSVRRGAPYKLKKLKLGKPRNALETQLVRNALQTQLLRNAHPTNSTAAPRRTLQTRILPLSPSPFCIRCVLLKKRASALIKLYSEKYYFMKFFVL